MELEIEKNNFSAAIEAYRRWMLLAGFGYADRERLLGECFARAGRLEDARAAWERALKANPLDLASLEAFAKNGGAEASLVSLSARAVSASSYNLDYLNNVVEACIAAGRADAARLIVRQVSSWFISRRSMYWCLAAARADEAAGFYREAALQMKQAREWRSTAPEDEISYYLERELVLLVAAGLVPDAVSLYQIMGKILDDEASLCLQLRIMRATNAPASMQESAIIGYLAGENGTWLPLNTSSLEKIDHVYRDGGLREIRSRLWRLFVSRHQDAVSQYGAGKFFLENGQPKTALACLQMAGTGMRAFGRVSVELALASSLLGLTDDAILHASRARYLLGHETYQKEAVLLSRRVLRDAVQAAR
jgi:tetratricopeptide (TPR) repeat protein